MTYGELEYDEMYNQWVVRGRPDMLTRLKRLYASNLSAGDFVISNTPGNSEDLEWFMQRYPLEVSEAHLGLLTAQAERAKNNRSLIQEMKVTGAERMSGLKTLLELRDYQKIGVATLQVRKRLLVGDDLGLGKTAIAIGAHATIPKPTIIVCQTHLQLQWKAEFEKFLFGVECHIIKTRKLYELPVHDVLIITYSKLASWGDWLCSASYDTIVFDEAQELRRKGEPISQKYGSASAVAASVTHCLGLTATPIYNYGEEIFNVLNIIDPGVLGTRHEFISEWCSSWGSHYVVGAPDQMNAFLIGESGVFLRRNRADVGRELPIVTKVIETVDHDPEVMAEFFEKKQHLAKLIMGGGFEESGQAARELDLVMRQQTGVAKAPFVAEFVIERVMAGEKVVLAGWHRNVYEIWEECFKLADQKARLETKNRRCRSVLYSGSESPNQKAESVRKFTEDEAEVFILSLRSGAGLNGLQEKASLVVFGELDWSPQIHEQVIGRLNRDGQKGAVVAVYMVCEDGSDPTMIYALGVKREQSEGIVDGKVDDSEEDEVERKQMETRSKLLAKSVLRK